MKKDLWRLAFGCDCESGFPGCLHANDFYEGAYTETRDYLKDLVEKVRNGEPIPQQDIPAIANIFMVLNDSFHAEHPRPIDQRATKVLFEFLEIVESLLDKPIKEFSGKYAFLSNLYECDVEYNGIHYKNADAAFQAQNCIAPKDRMSFPELKPEEAIEFGRSVVLHEDRDSKSISPLENNWISENYWEFEEYSVMDKIVRAKFTQNPDLAEKLLETGTSELVYGNSRGDTTWGVDLETGEGHNQLGDILTEIREELWEKI